MIRNSNNPLITPDMVPPSREGYRVRGAFNPGATVFQDEVLLFLRIAEDCHAREGHVAVPYFRKWVTNPKVINDPRFKQLMEKMGLPMPVGYE